MLFGNWYDGRYGRDLVGHNILGICTIFFAGGAVAVAIGGVDAEHPCAKICRPCWRVRLTVLCNAMSENEIEVPLAGGNVNDEVVRVGDTVRRTMSAQSPSVHKLLLHLEARGFDAAPRFLGIDDKGREILSFIAGESGYPDYLWDGDAALIAGAKMLRQYHDAVADFDGQALTGWVYSHPDAAQREVVCHNDFAIYNMIFRDGVPVGIIDFDLAGPGPRIRDVAYLAYWFAPLSFSSDDMSEYSLRDLAAGSPRLKLFCHTYGIACDGVLLEAVVSFLFRMCDSAAVVSMVGEEPAARLQEGGHLDHWHREAVALKARLGDFAYSAE